MIFYNNFLPTDCNSFFIDVRAYGYLFSQNQLQLDFLCICTIKFVCYQIFQSCNADSVIFFEILADRAFFFEVILLDSVTRGFSFKQYSSPSGQGRGCYVDIWNQRF